MVQDHKVLMIQDDMVLDHKSRLNSPKNFDKLQIKMAKTWEFTIILIIQKIKLRYVIYIVFCSLVLLMLVEWIIISTC